MANKNRQEFNEQDFEKAYDQETSRINAQLDEEILFAMIGDVNTGKSSTINKLIGDEVAMVGAKPGETTGIDRYIYRDKIIFADTPGLDDINNRNSQETMKFYKNADVILFFLNAAGTVFSEGEKKSFEIISKENKNILFVLNKIDAADDIQSLVNYVKQNTENKYNVIPISSRTGENIDKLRNEILDILKKKNKEIQFARLMKAKSSTANKWIIA
ncbi:GTPase domain-containing protein, partial [Oceanobacillus massiliensis]|uniref:GTPase domain-containing protein n=1 Tax=Oceanobacillus massiliensis TaxID=1465765 RepID=UPI00301AFBE0